MPTTVPGGWRSSKASSPRKASTSSITRTIPRAPSFTHRWKETQLQQGALEVYPVCEWGAIERVQRLGRGKIIGLDATVRTGAIMVRKDSRVHTLADLRWHGGIVAGDDVDEATAAKLRRALNRAIDWLRENEDRSRQEVLRDLEPAQRAGGLMPELVGVKAYRADEFKEKVEWMMSRGLLSEAPDYAEVVRSK